MGDAELAEHLRGKVEDGEGLVVVLDARLRPIAHRVTAFAFCGAALLEPLR